MSPTNSVSMSPTVSFGHLFEREALSPWPRGALRCDDHLPTSRGSSMLRVMPAMESSITDHVWDLVELP